MHIAIVSLAGILILGTASIATADTRAVSSPNARTGSPVVFSDEEVRVIRQYYEATTSRNGKKKSGRRQASKPPGDTANLARGKPLPRDISLQTLPYELRAVLPPVEDGHERIIVNGNVLLFEVTTQEVRDILSGVATR